MEKQMTEQEDEMVPIMHLQTSDGFREVVVKKKLKACQ